MHQEHANQYRQKLFFDDLPDEYAGRDPDSAVVKLAGSEGHERDHDGREHRAPHLVASRQVHVKTAAGEIARQQRRTGSGSYHKEASRLPQRQRENARQYQCSYRRKDESRQ